jgi:S-adenosylmethionine-dependent methyltransferase
MTTSAQVFDDHLSKFKQEQDAPWGRLRYGIVQTNLQRHLDPVSPRVLDAGGGNGLDALAFARQGSEVALLDYSTGMLDEARRVAVASGLDDRMSFHLGDISTLPSLFPDPVFDVVLCHNILQYVDDLPGALQALCRVLKPNGLISVMCVNRDSEPFRLALQQLNPEAARTSLDRPPAEFRSAMFGTPMHLYTSEEMVHSLDQAGCSTLGEYGVRCVCDYIPNNDIKHDPAFFAQLEHLELALTDRLPYRLLARYFQVIARKTRGTVS